MVDAGEIGVDSFYKSFDGSLQASGCSSPAWSPQATGTAMSPWMHCEGLPEELNASEVRPTFLLNVPLSHTPHSGSEGNGSPRSAASTPTGQFPGQDVRRRGFLNSSGMGTDNITGITSDMSGAVSMLGMKAVTGPGKGSNAEKTVEEVKRMAQHQRRSAIARGRLRDERGHFLSSGVALKINTLEADLQDSQAECSKLREEVKRLRQQLEEVAGGQPMSRPMPMQRLPSQMNHGDAYMAPPVSRSFLPIDYSRSSPHHTYMPSLYSGAQDRQPFKDKVDFSKVNLRKTNSAFMTDEERQIYYNQQLQWEIGQGVNDIRRKADEQMRLIQHRPPPPDPYSQFVGPVMPGQKNAPPSSVFSQPNKIGNVLLPAFSEKVDLAQQVSSLKKTEDMAHIQARQAEQIERQHQQIEQQRRLIEQQQQQMRMQEQQHMQQQQQQEQLLHQRGGFPMTPQSFQPDFWGSPRVMEESYLSPDMHVDRVSSPVPEDDMQVVQGYEDHGHGHRLGGPPSDIYSPPEKIGNRHVQAFRQKVNFAEIQLNKTNSPFASPETGRK